MQWDTRNFGQKLGAGLGAGLQNLSQLMLMLQGQKREDAEAAESKRRFKEMMNFRNETLQLQKNQAQTEAMQKLHDKLTASPYQDYGVAVSNWGGNPTTWPGTAQQRWNPQLYNKMNAPQESYKPQSPGGKLHADSDNMNIPIEDLIVPKEETPPKVKDVPNLVEILLKLYNTQTPDEKTGQMPLSIDDIFNQNMRHRFGLYRRNFPDDFGPNAEDSVLSTAKHGHYPHYTGAGGGVAGLSGLLTGSAGNQAVSPNIPPPPDDWPASLKEWEEFVKMGGLE